MRDFFKMFSASLLALTVAVGGILLAVLLSMALMAPSGPKVAAKSVLVFDLSDPIPDSYGESNADGGIQKALIGRGDAGLPLSVLVETLDRAAKDNRIVGLYLTGSMGSAGYASGLAALREVREALQRFRATGKPLIAYNQTWGKRELYLCAMATSLSVNPFGAVDLTGFASEPMFYGGAFKKYGIEVQVARVGKFKGAVEPFIAEKLSDENREQIQKYLDDLWGEWTQAIARDRKRTPADVQTLSDERGLLSPSEALAAGIMDRQSYHDEVLEELKKLTGKAPKDRTFTQISLDDYAKTSGDARSGARIAVVYAEGDIVDGEGAPNQVGGDRVSAELRRIRLDPDIKAVVLRVNSPGGSAFAADLIQREVVLTKKVKPLVVSMGSYAASGGYWISTHGDRIVAEPTSLTGSIGVFSLLPNVKKLANTFGITWDSVQTSKLANSGTLARPKTEAEMARLQALTDEIYDQFLTKVAEGRRLKKEAVHEIAQGRIWSGQEALRLGLVDELGGLQDAVRAAARLAKVEGGFRVDPMEPPRSPLEKVMELLSRSDRPKATRSGPAGQLQGELAAALASLAALNDPQGVYARLPFDIKVK
jgi:protease IV